MYTLKIVTEEGTYLFEARNVQYKIFEREDFLKMEKENANTVFGSDPYDLKNKYRIISKVTYRCPEDIRKVFYLTMGILFVLQNGKTVDIINVN